MKILCSDVKVLIMKILMTTNVKNGFLFWECWQITALFGVPTEKDG